MAHGDTVSHGNGAEFARGAAGGGHADERLVDLLGGQPHGIEIRAMRRAFRPLRHVTARQSLLDVGLVSNLGVHREPVSPANPRWSRKDPSQKAGFSFAFASAVAVGLRRMISWRGVAKKRRGQELAVLTVKSWRTVA